MNDLTLYELLKRQQCNELTPEEAQLLDNWYNGLERTPSKKIRIRSSKSRVWSTIENKLALQERKTIPLIRYAVAASTITIMLCAALYLLYMNKRKSENNTEIISMQTISAPPNEHKRFTLKDGSVVWLNEGAILDYPPAFDSVRNVYLKYGEAFFEIKKDTSKPFIVHCGQLRTRVLGTSFDIRNRNGQFMVAVASGKVRVFYGEKENQVAISHVLNAGERLTTDSSGNRPVIDSLDKTLYKGWTDKGYYLRDVSLTGIAYCMESLYGVNVRIQSEPLKQLLFTTGFSKKDTVTEILSRLSLAGSFHYKTDATGTVIIY